MDNSELIQQARELCEKATPGDWYLDMQTYIWSDHGVLVCQLKDNYKGNGSFILAARTLVPQLCDALEAMTARAEKAEAENRWIPVSERLPEDIYGSNREQITVLVCTESKKVSASSRTRLYCWSGADRCLKKTNEFQWNKGKRVTHWRPLPEPPKGE